MTTRLDDAIEVLSVHPEPAAHRYLDLSSPGEDNLRVLPPGAEPPTEKQKRIARIVMVVATLMLVSSVLLVTVTLSMSDHIDEMVEEQSATTIIYGPPTRPVRKVNGLPTTLSPTPPTPTKPSPPSSPKTQEAVNASETDTG